MNTMLLSAEKNQNKIGILDKSFDKSDNKNQKDFFENIIENFLNNSDDEKTKNILIGKLLNIPIDDKGINDFLKDIDKSSIEKQKSLDIKDNRLDILENLVEDLFRLSLMLKNGDNLKNFKTDFEELKDLSANEGFQQKCKCAKNINDLLKIAQESGIKVKKIKIEKIELNQSKNSIKSDFLIKLLDGQNIINNTENTLPKDTAIKTVLSEISKKIEMKTLKSNENEQEIKPNKNIILPKENQKQNLKNILKDTKDTIVSGQMQVNHYESKEIEKYTKTKNIDQEIKEKNRNIKIEINNQEPKKILNDVKQQISTHIKQQEKTTNKHIENYESIKDKDIEIENKKVLKDNHEDKSNIKTIENKNMRFDKELIRENQKTMKDSKILVKTNKSESIKDNISLNKVQDENEKIIVKKENGEEINKEQEKPEHLNISKTDSTKHHSEHKKVTKTLNTFAQEFKEQVENYKPPLMKIKMQLKPVGLGDVDVTMVNRGNNLHITVSSNQNTIAIFSQNQTEFKNSLVNMGFNELNMNFNENGKNKDEQNQKKNEKSTFQEIQDEDSFEITTSLYV